MANSRLCSIPDCGKPLLAKDCCSAHYWRLRVHGDPLGGGPPRRGDILRWVHDVAMHHGDECLIWPFGTDGHGYGVLYIDGKRAGAHRYVCELAHGAPPTPKHEAAHSCGHGKDGCVNRNHLLWKTRIENQADRLEHGTHNRGTRQGGAKLTEDDVREIIALKGIEMQRNLAERFGVRRTTIASIQQGRNWAWVQAT